MSYTNEPWPVFSEIATTMTPDPEGTPVAILSWDDYIRARACVNACAGIPTDELEMRGLIGFGTREGQKAMKQRDELLAALERMDGWLKDRHLGGLMPDELALIASVKGGA